MSIVKGRFGQDVIFECDSCGEEFDTETTAFDEAVQALKDEEWWFVKEGRQWSHYCPGCKDGYR